MTQNSTTWSYTYNADGLRTQRSGGGTTYNYIYNGDKLSQMTKGSDTLNFFYDASGTPMSVQYNGTTYYYVTNIQGDVIAILNGSGSAEVEYLYNAWGELVSTTGSMATTLGETNPLRYRGYVYDTETELYYLSTRYYNPDTGRFLNADAFASTGQGLLGNNMFAYCDNSPVANLDSYGNMKQRIKEFYAAGVGGGGAAAGLGAGLFALINQFAKDTSDLIAQTKAQAAAKRRENKNREYSVYFLTEADSTSDKIVYVGRVKTANMGPRMNYHRTKNREFAYSIDNLTYSECRILEQAGMSYHHSINRGNAVNNQIRGISITNGSAFLEVIKVFTDSIDYVDNEFLPSSYIVNQYENWLLNGG